jgi:hypothetical protein
MLLTPILLSISRVEWLDWACESDAEWVKQVRTPDGNDWGLAGESSDTLTTTILNKRVEYYLTHSHLLEEDHGVPLDVVKVIQARTELRRGGLKWIDPSDFAILDGGSDQDAGGELDTGENIYLSQQQC